MSEQQELREVCLSSEQLESGKFEVGTRMSLH